MSIIPELVENIGGILYSARKEALKAVNFELVKAYWNIGKHIIEYEQKGKIKAALFDVDVRTISEHLVNIYEQGEFTREATIRKFRTVQNEGKRQVTRDIEFYNLDAIISAGYRVNSTRATEFRQWATKVLREFAIKGYVLDRNRVTFRSWNSQLK